MHGWVMLPNVAGDETVACHIPPVDTSSHRESHVLNAKDKAALALAFGYGTPTTYAVPMSE